MTDANSALQDSTDAVGVSNPTLPSEKKTIKPETVGIMATIVAVGAAIAYCLFAL